MTAFTTLTAGENALSLAMANELVTAYSERRQALGQSAVSALTAGTTANYKTLWLAMQVWMEANCTSFVDHVSGPLNSGGTDFLYFTLATWRAAAGLNAGGFRRSVDGTTMAFGNITAGDVWGKWTFEDLQKGFAALKWTASGNISIVDAISRYGFSGYKSSSDDAWDAMVISWDASSWGAESDYADGAWSQMGYDLGGWYGYLRRVRGKYSISCGSFCSRDVELWTKEKAYYRESDVFYAQGDYPAGPAASLVFKKTLNSGDTLINPVSFDYISGTGMPERGPDPEYGEEIHYGWTRSAQIAVIKWNFTNS